MKRSTRERKIASKGFRQLRGDEWARNRLCKVLMEGKLAFDAMMLDMGKMFAEAIMDMDREERSGPDYHPLDPNLQKWASQPGSVYIGDQKVRVDHPRLRDQEKGCEIPLESYLKMKQRGQFSEELLEKIFQGISAQKYSDTVISSAQAFGVSPSAISQRIVEATGRRLGEFKNRSLAEFRPFALFLDTIHRGGQAFIVALGLNVSGEKLALGFWEGSSENSEVCHELLSDMESRGLVLSKRILWVTDGGSGIRKALRGRFGKKLLHQRCTIHKDRNIQGHLPKRYRTQAHRLFKAALEQNSYSDARKMLLEFETWLREINESAADSLKEAFEEILTLHRLKVPALLRKTLYSTNPIESMFSRVRDCEKNVKRARSSQMRQRWLAAVLMHCEKSFRRVKGYLDINEVIASIEQEFSKEEKDLLKAA
ncbi:MAG: transposase [Candidatus Eisenbacteria bacterium]|nr:transposase [Candidatus Eisenbacteria bacterium]